MKINSFLLPLLIVGPLSAQTLFINSLDSFDTEVPVATAAAGVLNVSGSWDFIPGTGLSGTVSLAPTATSDNYFSIVSPFSLVDNPILEVSLYFQRANGLNFAIPQLGLMNVATAGNQHNATGMRLTQSGSDVILQTRVNNGTPSGGSGPVVPMVAGNWYKMAVTYEVMSPTEIEVTGSIFNASNTGEVGSLVAQHTSIVANTFGLSNLAEVYAGVRVQSNGVSGMDNLSVVAVPEPATIGLLAGITALGVVFISRRRR